MLPAAAPANAVIFSRKFLTLKDFVSSTLSYNIRHILLEINFVFLKLITGFIIKCVAFVLLYAASNTYLELLFPFTPPVLNTTTTTPDYDNFTTAFVNTIIKAAANSTQEKCKIFEGC
jgi:hypothetical protein